MPYKPAVPHPDNLLLMYDPQEEGSESISVCHCIIHPYPDVWEMGWMGSSLGPAMWEDVSWLGVSALSLSLPSAGLQSCSAPSLSGHNVGSLRDVQRD